MGIFNKKEPRTDFCPKCGNVVKETDDYCVNCGTSMKELLDLDKKIKIKKKEKESELKSIISSDKSKEQILNSIKKTLNGKTGATHKPTYSTPNFSGMDAQKFFYVLYNQNDVLIQQNEINRRQNEKIIELLEKLVNE